MSRNDQLLFGALVTVCVTLIVLVVIANNSSDIAAAWVQAIGVIGALGVTVYIAQIQRVREDAAREAKAKTIGMMLVVRVLGIQSALPAVRAALNESMNGMLSCTEEEKANTIAACSLPDEYVAPLLLEAHCLEPKLAMTVAGLFFMAHKFNAFISNALPNARSMDQEKRGKYFDELETFLKTIETAAQESREGLYDVVGASSALPKIAH